MAMESQHVCFLLRTDLDGPRMIQVEGEHVKEVFYGEGVIFEMTIHGVQPDSVGWIKGTDLTGPIRKSTDIVSNHMFCLPA